MHERLYVWRKYADMECRDRCGVKGAPTDHRIFCTVLKRTPTGAWQLPRCWGCVIKRHAAKRAAKDLSIQLRIKEMLARRRKATFGGGGEHDLEVQAVVRRAAVRRRLVRALRAR